MIHQLASALDVLEIDGPTRYRWHGDAFDLPESVRRLAPPEGLRAALLQAIQWRLYADFFTAGGPRAAGPTSPATSDAEFAQRLSDANSGAGATETGWRYRGRDEGRLVVERLGLSLWARPDEVLTEDGLPPVVGQLVAVRMANEAPRLSPGFYMALSDVGLDPERPRVLDRYYLHVEADHAAECVALVTARLNRARLPFRLKLLNDPAAYGRCDTAVLSLQRRQRREAIEHVLALAEALRPGLSAAAPAMTLPLAFGVSFAEDPGDGESFGAQRCGVIASALVAAHEIGHRSTGNRLEVVREHMARVETTPEAPYLGPRTAGDPRALFDCQPEHEEAASWR